MNTIITLTGDKAIQAMFTVIAGDDMRKRLLMKLSQAVVSNSKKRVRDQTGLNGTLWAPRSNSRRRKKMLTKIGQSIQRVNINANEATIGFSSAGTGAIAAMHQDGYSQQFTSQRAQNRPNALRKSSPATKRQAAELLAAGFKIRLKKGGFKTPTKKWITEHITAGKAGVILKALGVETKRSWATVLPPRSFLGVTDAELPMLSQIAINEMKSSIGL